MADVTSLLDPRLDYLMLLEEFNKMFNYDYTEMQVYIVDGLYAVMFDDAILFVEEDSDRVARLKTSKYSIEMYAACRRVIYGGPKTDYIIEDPIAKVTTWELQDNSLLKMRHDHVTGDTTLKLEADSNISPVEFSELIDTLFYVRGM